MTRLHEKNQKYWLKNHHHIIQTQPTLSPLQSILYRQTLKLTDAMNQLTNDLKNHFVITIEKLEERVKVVVEHVTAMPGQGVTSMFNFGQSFGVIKGVCAALKLPIYFVRPMKWKKHFNLIKTNKDASRTKAIEIYPSISNKLSRKKDCNKADAILIARYFHYTQF